MVYRHSSPEALTSIAALTNPGRFAQSNDDFLLIDDFVNEPFWGQKPYSEKFPSQYRFVLGVFDGTGLMESGGGLASQTAAETVHRWLDDFSSTSSQIELRYRLINALEAADSDVLYLSRHNERAAEAVTTATIAAITPKMLQIANVGDSRAFLLRKNHLFQLTRDDSLLNRYLTGGVFSVEEVEGLENSHFITQALGTQHRVRPFTLTLDLCLNDTLLLCTRGLTTMVKHAEIELALTENSDPQSACEDLVERANSNGGYHNTTVIVVRFDGEWLPEPTEKHMLKDANILGRARRKKVVRVGLKNRLKALFGRKKI